MANTTIYSPELGYGLDRETDFRDRGEPDAVRRDFTIAGDYPFQVDLPDGDYHVTVISGDRSPPTTRRSPRRARTRAR